MTDKQKKFSLKGEIQKRALGPLLKMFGKGEGLLEIIGELESRYRKGVVNTKGGVTKLEDDETLHLFLSDVKGVLRITFVALKMDMTFKPLLTMEFEKFLLQATKMMK